MSTISVTLKLENDGKFRQAAVYHFPDNEVAERFIGEVSRLYRADYGPQVHRPEGDFVGDVDFSASKSEDKKKVGAS